MQTAAASRRDCL